MSYTDPLRAELEQWRQEAQDERRSRVRATESYEALRDQTLRLRAAGGALAALVADLMAGETDDGLRRLCDEALDAWSKAEGDVTDSQTDDDG